MDIRRREEAHEDERGFIYDLLVGEPISAVGLVTFESRAIRGNHIHAQTSQWNYVISGELLVVVEKDGLRTTSTFLEGDLFLIPPGEAHAMQALSASQIMVFTLGPRGGKDYEKDTMRLTDRLISE